MMAFKLGRCISPKFSAPPSDKIVGSKSFLRCKDKIFGPPTTVPIIVGLDCMCHRGGGEGGVQGVYDFGNLLEFLIPPGNTENLGTPGNF